MEANKQSDFVRENVRTLLQKELEYLSVTQESSRRLYVLSIMISAGVFILVVIVMILYSGSFSKQLIGPLENLTKTAQKVAAGEMDIPIDQTLLNQKDEVGLLSASFIHMVDTIKSKIVDLNASNDQLQSSKKELEEGNKELEKLNAFMVDRELKMIELKKRIAELENGK